MVPLTKTPLPPKVEERELTDEESAVLIKYTNYLIDKRECRLIATAIRKIIGHTGLICNAGEDVMILSFTYDKSKMLIGNAKGTMWVKVDTSYLRDIREEGTPL